MRIYQVILDFLKIFCRLKPKKVKNYFLRIKNFHKNNSIEKRLLSNYIKKLKVKKLLDYGCNDCFLNKFLKNKIKYFGIDNNSELLKQKKFSKNFFYEKNFKYNLYKNYFDCIIISHVIAHIYYDQRTLKKLSKLLKNNGYLIIITPNKTFKFLTFFYNIFNNYYPDMTISHYHSHRSLKKLLIMNSFKIKEIFTYSISKNKISKSFINSRTFVLGKKKIKN